MSLPYMKFWVGDYLKDTMHLDARSHGAYMLILMHLWNNAQAMLKHCPSICKLSNSEWNEIKDDILGFFEIDGEIITHSRLNEEKEYAQIEATDSKTRASKAAKKRWDNERAKKQDAQALPQHMLEQCPSNANHSHSHSHNTLFPSSEEKRVAREREPTPFSISSKSGFVKWTPKPETMDLLQRSGITESEKVGVLSAYLEARVSKGKSVDFADEDFPPTFEKWISKKSNSAPDRTKGDQIAKAASKMVEAERKAMLERIEANLTEPERKELAFLDSIPFKEQTDAQRLRYSELLASG